MTSLRLGLRQESRPKDDQKFKADKCQSRKLMHNSNETVKPFKPTAY